MPETAEGVEDLTIKEILPDGLAFANDNPVKDLKVAYRTKEGVSPFSLTELNISDNDFTFNRLNDL